MPNKILKFSIAILLHLLLTLSIYAQSDVTQFLGIPVDGDKLEMLKKLKAKGFNTSPYDKDVLFGEFNGTAVNIQVVTNNNKVCRIVVSDANGLNEADIKVRFNNLCEQFKNNKKYFQVYDTNFTILDDEDIDYGLNVKNKRYQAAFYQLPKEGIDSSALIKELVEVFLNKYTLEQLSNPSEEIEKRMKEEGLIYVMDKYSKKVVWFMIKKLHGEYYIVMYYDNEYNRAQGEDL